MRTPRALLILATAGGLQFPAIGMAVPSCTVTVSGLNFGTVSLGNQSNVDTTGNVEIACNNPNTTYTLLLSTGAGTYALRQMTSGGNRLGYNIYTSSTYITVWGDGTGGSSTVVGVTPSNANGANNHGINTLYGRIPLASLQTAHTGSYTDIIVVTLNY